MSIFIDFITNIGLEVFKEKQAKFLQENELRKILSDYISRHKKYNLYVSKDEEMDFQAVEEYIITNLLNDVRRRLFGDKKEREIARNEILTKTTGYAISKTNLSAQRATRIVADAVDILRKIYRSRLTPELQFVAAEIEDTLHENELIEHEKTRDLIKDIVNTDKNLSLDHNFELAKRGELSVVQANIKSAINAIGTAHKLYPYYGYRFSTDNSMISVPLCEEAKKKYPPQINITTNSVQLGNGEVDIVNGDILRTAYRHQLPISFTVVTAKKLLGTELDPIQDEADKMIGAHVIIKPPEFSPAFPCNVLVGDEVVVPYLLLRTKEILEDETIIITNDEQKNFPFKIEIRMNPVNNRLNFSVNTNNLKNVEALKYRRFLKRVKAKEKVAIHVLSLNQDLVFGSMDDFEYDGLDWEIEFLEKIIKLEEYFKREISIPKAITADDRKSVDTLCRIIDGHNTGTWDKFYCTFIVSDECRERIMDLRPEIYSFGYSSDRTFNVFGEEYTIMTFMVLNSAVVKDLDKIKEKAESYEDGELIRISFESANECGQSGFKEVLYTEEIEINLMKSNK